MIPVNRETLMMIGTVVCILGLVFLFKELNKTKQDIDNFKNFSAQVVRHLSPPEPPVEKETEKKEEPEEENVEE